LNDYLIFLKFIINFFRWRFGKNLFGQFTIGRELWKEFYA
jgi:hypothetical protein